MQITRTTNSNGTYRYEIDGKVHMKASKVFYTHASSYRVGDKGDSSPVMFHKTAAAAAKSTGYTHLGWVKTGVYEIVDGDAAPAVQEEAPSEAEVMARVTGSRGATVVHERRNQDGTLTETSRESWGQVGQPATPARDASLDILARGVNCPKCGVRTDETCRTPAGALTLPHTGRINRAVKLYQAAKPAAPKAPTTSGAGRRAQDTVEILRAMLPSTITVERDGHQVFVYAPWQDDSGFLLEFGGLSLDMHSPTAKHPELVADTLYALTTIRNYYRR